MQYINLPMLLNSYPRQRPLLSERQKQIFEKEYRDNRNGATLIARLARKVDSVLHHMVARGAYGLCRESGDTLELGAGTLNHLSYESQLDADNYDVVEPYGFLLDNNPYLGRVRHIYDSSGDVPRSAKYSRIISLSVLEHMLDLPTELQRAGKLLVEGGIFQAGIPAESGIAWGLSWRLTTGLSYRLRTGLPYTEIMRHEHINSAPEIIALVNTFFNDVKVTWWPLPFFQGALFAYIEARNPTTHRVQKL